MKKVLLLLDELNNDDLDWIILKGRRQILYPGTVLIYEGKTINALYIVIRGNLSVSINSLENRELARISTGEVVGEISFIDARPPLATVQAIEESEVMAIPRIELTIKLQQDKGFASRFYHAISLCMAERLRGTVRRLGYGLELEGLFGGQEEPNPSTVKNLELAQAKFNWLLKERK